MGKPSLRVAVGALIASAYLMLTIMLGELGYSWIQVRISEALAPLPFFMGFPAVVGLTIGCFLANWFSPVGLADMIFGPLFTLVAAFLSWKFNFGKKIVACIYPVLINAFGVSAYLSSFYGVPYFVTVVTVGVGEFIATVLIGYPLLISVKKAIRSLEMQNNTNAKRNAHL